MVKNIIIFIDLKAWNRAIIKILYRISQEDT